MPDTVPPAASLPCPQRPPAWRRGAAAALVLLVLLLVFALYGNPDFMVMLADQMWTCF